MSGLEIIQQLRAEPFNKETEKKLQNHPFLKAAEVGTLTLSQRRAFAFEQYKIQLSDAISFAALAGHTCFIPTSLSNISVPELPNNTSKEEEEVDLFQFLLGGEVYAASLLLSHAKSLGIDDEDALRSPAKCGYQLSAKAQAYPSYWSKLALSNNRGAGAAAVALNFPAWGEMCNRLLKALASGDYGYNNIDESSLAFIKFFATPIEGLDKMAASIIDKEDISYDDLVEHVRLLQAYELLFWDGIYEG